MSFRGLLDWILKMRGLFEQNFCYWYFNHLPNIWQLDFLWACWFLSKNISNLVPPLENSTTHTTINAYAQLFKNQNELWMYLKSSILIWNRNLFSNILSFPNFFQLKLIKLVSVAAYSLVKSVAFPDFLSRKTARQTWALSSCKLRMKLLNRVASVTRLSLYKIRVGN